MANGWLLAFVSDYGASEDPGAATVRGLAARRPWTHSFKSAGKRWIHWSLHHRGLAYGLPLAQPGQLAESRAGTWDPAFAPFLTIWCDLMVEVDALVAGVPRVTGLREWLLSCLAVLVEADDCADQLHQAMVAGGANPRLLERSVRAIEPRLERRRYAVGNPLLGLPLRNGIVYSDARLVGRIALRLATEGRVDPVSLIRLRSYTHRERRLLVAALCSLVACGGEIPRAARRAAAAQLERAGLPADEVRDLQRLLRQPPSAELIAELVEGPRAAGYLIEQLLLAAFIDGWIDAEERSFIDQLATDLAVPRPRVDRIEWRVRRFCDWHRDLFDLFTESQYYGRLETFSTERITRLVLRNLDALVLEIRQTRELAALLTKAAAGTTLDQDERAAVRTGLLDICRAIPSLAIFALPGGALILPLLLKLLPWDLRPSAFQNIAPRWR